MNKNRRFIGVFRFLHITEKLEQFLTQAVVAGLVVLVISQVVLHRDASPLFNYGEWMAGNPIWDENGPDTVPAIAQTDPQKVVPAGRGTVTLQIDGSQTAPGLEIWVNNSKAGTFRNSSIFTVAVQAGDRITLYAVQDTEPVTVRVVAHSSHITSPAVGTRLSVQSGRVGFAPVKAE